MRYLIKNISKESFKPKRSLNQFDNERKNHKSKSQKIMVITMTLHEIRQAYEDNYLDDRGDSYWAGHAEAGFRYWMNNRVQLIELSVRYTWSSLDGDRDYWLAAISTGTNI